MILRFLAVVCMGMYMSASWSMSVKRQKISQKVMLNFFNILEQEDYGRLTNYSAVFARPVLLKNNDGDTPLHWAIRHNKTELLHWLLERTQYRCDIQERNDIGQTPFDLALQIPDKRNAALLLEYMDMLGSELKLALKTSIITPHIVTKEQILTLITNNYVELALLAIPFINNCNELVAGTTLLHAALDTGDSELIKVLLDAGASPTQVDSQGVTALAKAQKCADRIYNEVCKETYDFNAMHKCATAVGLLSSYQKDKKTLLFWLNKILASNDKDGSLDDIHCLEMLTDHVSINTRDDQGLTPLHKAVAAGKLGLIKLLLACGADLFMPDFTERTPFDIALYQPGEPLRLLVDLAYKLRALK